MSATWSLERLPFFDESHYRLAERLQEWRVAHATLGQHADAADFDPLCREILARLAEWGFLDYIVPSAGGGENFTLDLRAICLIREVLAFDSCLIDTVFVMQGLGMSPLWRHEDEALRARYLSLVRSGKTIAALALTEEQSGSDAAAIVTRAVQDGNDYVINGSKFWITNGGIADHYMVAARSSDEPGANGVSMFLVDADTPGLKCGPQEPMIADHPISQVTFRDCRVPASRMIGPPGGGFKAAMKGFDVFRPSVGGAALGIARRAMAEVLERVQTRHMFGKLMSQMDVMQAKVADMACDTETAAMAVYRAAWASDVIGGRISKEAAMAKLIATEAAQRVVDGAVQIFGAAGVSRNSVVENLYRDLRPMRIYEGASEIQKVVIARSILAKPPR